MMESEHLFRKRELLANLKFQEKEQKGRFGEIDDKIMRAGYTLNWSQSEVFLVSVYLLCCA